MQDQTIDDIVQNFLEILGDDKILPEVALVAAAQTVNDLAAIARSQQESLYDLRRLRLEDREVWEREAVS
jgi:hypothetical protein